MYYFKTFFTLHIIIILLLVAKSQANVELPEVETPFGKIQGFFSKSVNNRTFAAFEGIPYAYPPIGELRFEEAKALDKPWKGTWSANKAYKCLQYYHYTEPGQEFVIGEEDCLYVNIYTPILHPRKILDVIIFIHGGAFMFNNCGTYGPKILMDNDVIYVSLNYRLGPLGFLSTENKVVPGNNGLKDQLLALQWVKNNIGYFGGNKNSITLAGMSAGGASVHLHTLNPLAEGLFQRGIAQSGTALNNWVLVENSREKTKKLGNLVGCDQIDIKEMVDCLKTRPAKQIVNTVKYFQPFLYNPFSPFAVVIDSWANSPVVPVHPYKLITEKRMQNIPLIFSNVQAEGLYPASDFISDPNHLVTINENWDDLIPFILDYNNTVKSTDKSLIAQKIRREYLQNRDLNKDTFKDFVQIVSDRLFISDIERAAKLHSTSSKSPVYYYTYHYRAAHSKSEFRTKSNKNYGTSHGDDTICVLSSNVNCQSTENDREMSRILQNMWIQFDKIDPLKIGNIEWKPISKNPNDDIIFLNISSPTSIRMESRKFLGNRPFWESLPFQENERLLSPDKDEL